MTFEDFLLEAYEEEEREVGDTGLEFDDWLSELPADDYIALAEQWHKEEVINNHVKTNGRK